MPDDWSLKGKRFNIEQEHGECFQTEIECCSPSLEREYKKDGNFHASHDIDVLRRKLIEDIEEKTGSDYDYYDNISEVKNIINKRFGV